MMRLSLESLESRNLLSVASAYAALLHRTPVPAEVAGWEAISLPADVQTAAVAASDEYRSRLTPKQWLGHVYGDLLGRDVDATGTAAWLPGLQSVPALFRTALAITHSEEYALRGGIDPITFPDGSVLTAAAADPLPMLPPIPGGTVTLTFYDAGGNPQQITVQDLTFPPQQWTALRLYPADGGDPLTPVLPATALGSGLEPPLAYDAAADVAYLAVAGASALDGAGLQVFASTDHGHTFALRGVVAWPAGTVLSAPSLTTANGVLTLTYTASPNTVTWTSADPTPHSDAGTWTATSTDGGVTWDGRGVKA